MAQEKLKIKSVSRRMNNTIMCEQRWKNSRAERARVDLDDYFALEQTFFELQAQMEFF